MFRCFTDPLHCPGDQLRACAEGRHGVLCSECEPGKMPGVEGKCEDCGAENSSGVPLALMLFFAVAVLLAVCVTSDVKSNTKISQAALLVHLAVGDFIVVLQLLGILNLFAVGWPEPMGSMLKLSTAVVFNFEILQLNCFSSLSTTDKYLFRMSVVAVGLVLLLLIHLFAVSVLHGRDFQTHTCPSSSKQTAQS